MSKAPVSDSTAVLLDVQDVAVRFGGIVALGGVSFSVERGQICGLIGPNGSGKTTLFNCISGIYKPGRGDIRFCGQSLTQLKRHQIVGIGIGRTFQNIALFNSMSVRDNVLTGAHHLSHSGFLSNALRLPRVEAEVQALEPSLLEILHLLDLGALSGRQVGDLPFGTRKRVELARALISGPQLLLLDEPAGGLAHGEVDELGELFERIRSHYQLSILLVEHHMALVMRVSEKVVALEFGLKIADGSPEQVRNEPEVIRAYLGAQDDAAAA